MKKYICLFLTLWGLLPGFAQQTDTVVLNLSEAITHEPKVIMLSEIASDIHFISLETTDDFFLCDEYRIIYTGDDILVYDRQMRNYFRFDKNGKLLNRIGEYGQKTENYLVGLSFSYDYSEKRVYVHDIRTLVCYDLNGKFIKRIPVPHLNGDACVVFDKGHILYSDSRFYIDRDNPLQLFLTDETGKELKVWQGYVEKYKSYKALMSTRDLMYNYQGAVYFKPAFENLIYRIDGQGEKTVAWQFDCSGYEINVSVNEADPKNRYQAISVQQVFESDHYLFVSYILRNNNFTGLYDKDQRTFSNVIVKDDLSGGFDFIFSGIGFGNQLMNAHAVSYAKKAERYPEALLPSRRQELDSLVNQLRMGDNPVISITTLK